MHRHLFTIPFFIFVLVGGEGRASPACDQLGELARKSIASEAPQDPQSRAEQDYFLTNNVLGQGHMPVDMDGVGPAHGRIQDQPFTSLKLGSVEIPYAELPPSVRRTDFKDALFFGRRGGTLEEAHRYLSVVFQFGRTRRGKVNSDLEKHVAARSMVYESGEASAYIQTSSNFNVAFAFAMKRLGQVDAKGVPQEVGIVLIIDGKGAQLLDVLEAAKLGAEGGKVGDRELNYEEQLAFKGVLHYAQAEKEFLFEGTLAPQRIYGAMLVRWTEKARFETRKMEDVEVVSVVRNPNYRSQSPRPEQQ